MEWTENKFLEWARKERKKLCRDFFDRKQIDKSNEKIAIFMAGSPGAGKTEFIKRLLTEDQESAYYILDLDEVRQWMPSYKGNYADIYTKGAIKILELLFDTCIEKNYNFILDGTFTSTHVIDKNMRRLIKKGYTIHVFYIHTNPYLAWAYTLLRDSDDGRRVPIKTFIRYYQLAHENICRVSKEYEGKIQIHVAHKIRNSKGEIELQMPPYNCLTSKELENTFDNKVTYYYNLGRDGITELSFFWITKFISLLPIIGKPLLRYIAQIPRNVKK